jgi:hypothetical protein
MPAPAPAGSTGLHPPFLHESVRVLGYSMELKEAPEMIRDKALDELLDGYEKSEDRPGRDGLLKRLKRR